MRREVSVGLLLLALAALVALFLQWFRESEFPTPEPPPPEAEPATRVAEPLKPSSPRFTSGATR